MPWLFISFDCDYCSLVIVGEDGKEQEEYGFETVLPYETGRDRS